MLIAVAIVGVLMYFLVAVPASRSKKAAEMVRSARPDAVVVGTYWDEAILAKRRAIHP